MVKTLKNLLQNQESFKAESWYIALGSYGLICSNNDGRLTYDLFMAGKICNPYNCLGKC